MFCCYHPLGKNNDGRIPKLVLKPVQQTSTSNTLVSDKPTTNLYFLLTNCLEFLTHAQLFSRSSIISLLWDYEAGFLLLGAKFKTISWPDLCYWREGSKARSGAEWKRAKNACPVWNLLKGSIAEGIYLGSASSARPSAGTLSKGRNSSTKCGRKLM